MMRLSDGTTIADWQRPVLPPPEIEYVEPLPDPAEVLAERVAMALADLKDALNTMPAPQVHVAAPELGAIVQAVTSLNGPATAEDIAGAIADRLHFPAAESNQPLVDAIVRAFEKMDHRMQGMVPAFGASGPSNISDNAARQLGHTTVDNFPASQVVADAAEDASLTPAPFTFTAAGSAQVIVAAPGGGSLLRLRRISPTYAIRSSSSEPILSLKVGSTEAQRGNALTGRFDIPAAATTDAITLDIDILDAGGQVCGTVYYELV